MTAKDVTIEDKAAIPGVKEQLDIYAATLGAGILMSLSADATRARCSPESVGAHPEGELFACIEAPTVALP